MQKRKERLAKITILPATGSRDRTKSFSFRETSEIYKQLIIMIDTYNNERAQENNECAFCGETYEKTYCSTDCKKADSIIED